MFAVDGSHGWRCRARFDAVSVPPMSSPSPAAAPRVTLAESARERHRPQRGDRRRPRRPRRRRVRRLDRVRFARDDGDPARRREELQRALIRSHAAGMGPLVEPEVVRAMMLLRARTLAMGFCGVRQVVVDTILALLNAGITPAVHEHGSLGASGDLAPLAHVALALIGEGEVPPTGDRAGGRRSRPVEPLRGQGGAGADQRHRRHARHAGARARRPRRAAAHRRHRRRDERRGVARHRPRLRRRPAWRCGRTPARPRRPPTCAACSPARPIVASHRTDDPRVQDAYSLRCTPQVHGAARDTLAFADARSPSASWCRRSTTRWCCPTAASSRADNFHGAPLGFACDFLAIAAADVGAIAERRTDRLLDRDPLARPAAVPRRRRRRQLRPDDRPLHAGGDGRREPPAGRAGQRRLAADHRRCRRTTCRWAGARRASCAVARQPRRGSSPSSWSARHAGIDLRAPLQPGAGHGRRARPRCARPASPGAGPDRWLSPELAAAEQLVTSGDLLAAVERSTGR